MAMHRVSGAGWLRCALAVTARAAVVQAGGGAGGDDAGARGGLAVARDPAAHCRSGDLRAGLIVRTTSDASGEYVLAALPPGTSWIVVTGAGPARSVQRTTVRVGQNVSLNLSSTSSRWLPPQDARVAAIEYLRRTRPGERAYSVGAEQRPPGGSHRSVAAPLTRDWTVLRRAVTSD